MALLQGGLSSLDIVGVRGIENGHYGRVIKSGLSTGRCHLAQCEKSESREEQSTHEILHLGEHRCLPTESRAQSYSIKIIQKVKDFLYFLSRGSPFARLRTSWRLSERLPPATR